VTRPAWHWWVSWAFVIAAGCGGSAEKPPKGESLNTGGTGIAPPGGSGAGGRTGAGGRGGAGASSGFSGDGGLSGSGWGGDGGLAGSGPGGSGGTGIDPGPFDAGPLDAGEALVCGNVTCPGLPGNPVASAACCVAKDADDSVACGYLSSNVPFQPFRSLCHAADQPGTLDPSCPDSVLYFDPSFPELARFKGCCRPDSRCGNNFGPGFGCIALENVNGGSQTCVAR
jgi:hypothetical protein